MKMREVFALRRLRWKLAFSYTLVTVVALLALEILLVVAVITFVSSPVLPYLVSADLNRSVVSLFTEDLSKPQVDRAALRERVTSLTGRRTIVVEENGSGGSGGAAFNVTLAPDEGYFFLLDDEKQLLATSASLPGTAEDEQLDRGPFPGIKPLIDRAADGKEDPWQLSTYSPNGRQMYATAPVENENGEVLGVLVATFYLPDLGPPVFATALVVAGLLIFPAAFLGLVFGFLTAWGLTRRIGRLAGAARSWSRGDFSITTKDRSKDELGQLSRELNGMAAELDTLLQTRGELATLEARNRFARDLHDSVKQQVFATSLQIAAARAYIAKDTDAAEAHLSQADELVRAAQKELNVLIAEMRPAALEGKGLAVALREYVERWSGGAEIPADFHVQGERETSLEIEQALFRVAQEALANVARHSGATHAEIDLNYTTDTLTLRVVDDGKGFDTLHAPGAGFGLQSMRERLTKLEGSLDIESAPGKGTRVTCTCPLQKRGGNQ
ncbi:hypothetical protein BH24ACT22_BH24ACT22_11870 [soil metagenome]